MRPIFRGFPKAARSELGKAILKLQKGSILTLPLSRPMRQVGPGVEELRVRDASGIYRAFYLARIEDQVLVFHAFQKRTPKTPQREIDTGKRRLRELLNA
ncbi:MAG TPA: type II toxin-antitoxin system RelE/ParE family toxin [Bdellovibrionota bacterium]|nr:type II toxin-antitoxin system RelE/ParE family toxin [Bdellovibrionota bacterium]